MKILVTGANGFVGRNLVANLQNIQEGKNTTHPALHIDEIFSYDVDTPPELLDSFCQRADFVFHFAGSNRPAQNSEFMEVNAGLTQLLLNTLKKYGNVCPVMLSSSVQASLSGKYSGSEYGKSKLSAEKLVFAYHEETHADVFVYRLPNLFGKWCKPNYNSVIATFCHNYAHQLPIQVNNPDTLIEFLYIDDLIEEMYLLLEGHAKHCNYDDITPIPCDNGMFCYVPTTHQVTLKEIVSLLDSFQQQPKTLMMPEIPDNSFAKKLYSTYLSYLPPERMSVPLSMHCDERGSFTEMIKTLTNGQFSVNISRPQITKGQHWHNSKWEIFLVVSGHGLIRERCIQSGEILEFEVTGEKLEAVYMLPGYTHSIINLSDTENLITLMWANECFQPEKPDTFQENV